MRVHSVLTAIILTAACACPTWSADAATPASTADAAAPAIPVDVEGQRFTWAADPATMPAGGMAVSADLSDLPTSGLLYTRVIVPATPDEVLAYPLWIPGTHAPAGPVENLGGVRMHDDRHREVAWERDPHDPWRFLTHPAADAKRLVIDLTYIADQPTTNSLGVDVMTGDGFALMAWNCGLLYPVGIPVATLPCNAEMRLPAMWGTATRLRESSHDGDVHRYGVLPLGDLVDRPVMVGTHLQHVVLQHGDSAKDTSHPEVELHVAGAVLDNADVINGMRRLPIEATALFGGAWFDRYDFLLVIGDDGLGLEHGDCSVDGTTATGIASGDMWSRELMPHEFTHSWVGKYRRPIGMLTADFQQTPDFDGLWVYEGLTECLGRVLAVRSGLATAEDWRDTEFHELVSLANEPGRRWRSLRDTCRCNWQLRSGSDHHSELRRDQDYYIEGALFWIAVERRLRSATNGQRGLDDFCKAFFSPQFNHAGGFTEAEVIAALNAQAPGDWAGMVHRWMDATGDLDIDAVLGGSGWKMGSEKVDGADDDTIAQIHDTDIRSIVGLAVDGGTVTAVDPGSAAALAGLMTGDVIASANGVKLKHDPQALVRAIARAETPQAAQLTVSRHGQWSTLHLTLPNGLAIASLVRDDSLPDAFAVLLAPRAAAAATAPEPVTAPATAGDTTPAESVP